MRVTVSGFEYHEPKADKLSQLEDIEERHGIEILTVYKAMVNGFYYLSDGKIAHFIPDRSNFVWPNLNNGSVDLMWASPYEDAYRVIASFPFGEYGVTWALAREELGISKWKFVVVRDILGNRYESDYVYDSQNEAEREAIAWIEKIRDSIVCKKDDYGWKAVADFGRDKLNIAGGFKTEEEVKKIADDWVKKLNYSTKRVGDTKGEQLL